MTFITSGVFADWLDGLLDNTAKANILNRLARAQLGNFGDFEPVVDGVSEMRIHSGLGNRIYYVHTSKILQAVVLCCYAAATKPARSALLQRPLSWLVTSKRMHYDH